MRIALLGPIEVTVDGEPANLGGRQRRTLLAVLAVHSGETVSTDRLIDELWGDSPPESARKTVQAHVAHLRRALDVESEVLVSAGPGYVIEVDDEDIDVRRFERLVAAAAESRRTDPAAAMAELEEALSLFRGAPLAGIADDAWSLRVEASRIEEMRLGALEQRLELQVATGRASEAATEAERLLAEHPLRERLWALLMQALYGSGRQGEALQAFSRARQTLAEELGIEPSAELRDLEQRILQQDPDLEGATLELPSERAVAPTVIRNPYKGLRPFDEGDAADFFGREDLVRRLLERVEARRGPPVVVLAGPSGAGKSSAVRAGLIPRLRDQGRDVAVMFPGPDPLGALAKAVAEQTERSPSQVEDDLRSGRPMDFHGTLVVDQFEELFTMVEEPDEVDAFLDVITGRDHRTVVTMRADFLDRLLSHPVTGGLVEDALVFVPALQPHEIEAAVVEPARTAGVDVSRDLVERVVADVRARAAALPLLQFALTDTFERRGGDTLTLVEYERGGGLTGALARRADQVVDSFDTDHREGARQLLLNLVNVSDQGEWVRRRVTRKDLLSLPLDTAVVDKVIERLGSHRLLTFDQDPDTGDATIEVAHEALIAEWPRLAGWVEDARDDLRMKRRLAAASREWEESGRDPSFLLGGARLTEMEAWQETSQLELPSSERRLIVESRRAEDAAARRRTIRRRAIATVLSVAAAVAAVFAVIAFIKADEAGDQARIATVRELSAASAANLDADPELSLLLALEAVDESGEQVAPEAEEALHAAVQAHRTVLTRPSAGAAFFSPDGTRLVGGGEGDVPVWDLATGEQVLTLMGHTDRVFNAVWSPDGSMIATNSRDGTTRVWDATTGEELWQADVGVPVGVAFNPDSTLVATSYGLFTEGGAPVRVWDSATGDLVVELPHVFALGVNFGTDGRLGVADGDIGLTIWDTGTGEKVVSLDQFGPDVVFAPDGSFVAGSSGGDVVIYEAETWEVRHRLSSTTSEVGGVDVAPNGALIAAGDVDGRVQVWDPSTGESVLTLVGHGASVINVAFSPEGGILASSGEDGTIRLWDLTPSGGSERAAFPAPGGDVDYSPDGTSLASGAFGAGLRDAGTGVELQSFEGHEDFILRVEFSPSGDRVVTTSFDGTARLWDARTGAEVMVLDHGEPVGSASFDPEGARLATAGLTDVYLWDVATGERQSVVGAYEPPLRPDRPGLFDVEFSPDGTFFATSGGDGWIKLWDTASGSLVWESRGHTGSVDPGSRQIDFGPDGEMLASIGFDGVVKVWDAVTGDELRGFEGAGGELLAVDFDPAGTTVAVGGRDGRVTLWQVDGTGRLQIAALPVTVWGVEFSPDGRYLAVASQDDVVRVFILDVVELADLATERLTRWWTPEECLEFLHTETCPEPPPSLQGD